MENETVEFKLSQDMVVLLDVIRKLKTELAKNLIESAIDVIENRIRLEIKSND